MECSSPVSGVPLNERSEEGRVGAVKPLFRTRTLPRADRTEPRKATEVASERNRMSMAQNKEGTQQSVALSCPLSNEETHDKAYIH